MDLELAADPEAAARLGRLKSFASSREGRTRSLPVRIIWHDNPQHALLADGLTVSEQRGVWRLERIVPGRATWLPGAPAPVVGEAPDLTTLPSPLAPLAAFDGRRVISVHRFDGETVTVTIERGILRAVTAERPVARISLTGAPQAVHAAALLIAATIAVEVPVASLAAQGIALATGRAAPARHTGSPVLPEGLTGVADALAHIIGHLTDVVLSNAGATAELDDAGSDAVHQMRVAVRRARSALSVFRPAVEPAAHDAISAILKRLGDHLGPSRDWDVFVEESIPALQEALSGDERVGRLAAAAARRRRDCRTALTAYLAGPEFRLVGIELACFAASPSWRIAGEGPPPALLGFGAGVLQQRWRKLVSAGKRMDELDIPGLHAVRLRAKRARYAAEMFATLYPGKASHRFIRRLGALQQRLGVLNDGAVATHLLGELGGPGGRHGYAVGVVIGFMAARAGKIRPRIITAFEKFRRQPAYWT